MKTKSTLRGMIKVRNMAICLLLVGMTVGAFGLGGVAARQLGPRPAADHPELMSASLADLMKNSR